MMYEVE
jgi:hypothetical protein